MIDHVNSFLGLSKYQFEVESFQPGILLSMLCIILWTLCMCLQRISIDLGPGRYRLVDSEIQKDSFPPEFIQEHFIRSTFFASVYMCGKANNCLCLTGSWNPLVVTRN